MHMLLQANLQRVQDLSIMLCATTGATPIARHDIIHEILQSALLKSSTFSLKCMC